MRTPETIEASRLGKLVRRGKATEEESERLRYLQAVIFVRSPQSSPQTIFDLEIARHMWRADAKRAEGKL